MKIDDNNAFELARVSGSQPVQRVGPAFDLFAAYGVSPARGADQASLSTQGLEIQRLVKQVQELPEVREDRVQALETRLQDGSYQVPVPDLAEAMFRLAELDQG